MITYTASYAAGLGNIPWQQGELFRLEVRGIGTSLCTATSGCLVMFPSVVSSAERNLLSHRLGR